jgi:hypothetical protein
MKNIFYLYSSTLKELVHSFKTFVNFYWTQTASKYQYMIKFTVAAVTTSNPITLEVIYLNICSSTNNDYILFHVPSSARNINNMITWPFLGLCIICRLEQPKMHVTVMNVTHPEIMKIYAIVSLKDLIIWWVSFKDAMNC